MHTYIVVLAAVSTPESVSLSANGSFVENGVLVFTDENGKRVGSFAPGAWCYYVKQNSTQE